MNTIDNVLKAADKVLKFPSTTLAESCKEFGVKLSPVTGFLAEGLVQSSPLLVTTLWVVNKFKKNQREQQEKERMKNEIIRKQQAIIEKLKRQNELNSQEIKNLKDTLEMLNNVLSEYEVA